VENLNKSQLKPGIWSGKREGAEPPTPRPPRQSGDSHGLRRRRERARASPFSLRPCDRRPARDQRSVKWLPGKEKEMAFLTHLRQHLTAGKN
jgi:hypothetical protein